MPDVVDALRFYADQATYGTPPTMYRSCDSSWHDEGHSWHSTCPTCGGKQDRRFPVAVFQRLPIEDDHGQRARAALKVLER
jgi:hypothetical protein